MADVVDNIGRYNKNVGAYTSWVPLEAAEIEKADSVVNAAVNDDL